jgi:hypothetical protein
MVKPLERPRSVAKLVLAKKFSERERIVYVPRSLERFSEDGADS